MSEAAGSRDRQRELYGAPLGDIATGLMSALGLNQVRLAHALGLSAPMLSQLLSGQRTKIGNPAVVHRLQALSDLADDAARLTADEVAHRLEAIRTEQATITTRTTVAGGAVPPGLLDGLRGLASSSELARAANLLDAEGISDLAVALREASDQPDASAGG